jgi:hypothetical protein
MKLEFFGQILEKSLKIKFRQSPSSGSRVVPYGQTNMKLIVAFRNFLNVPKNRNSVSMADVLAKI